MVGFNTSSLFAEDVGFDDYRALVNVFLLGGNDAFNMVVPRSEAEYNAYARSRQNLSIAKDDLLAMLADNPDGALYGMHPGMPGLRDLFESGDLAVAANVGPLIEPTTREGYLNGTALLPPQLFSHNDQQSQWQTLRGISQLATGWAGRIADVMAPSTASQRLPLNVSASGNNAFQASEIAVPYTVGTDGANAYGAYGPDAAFGTERRAAFERLLTPAGVYARALGGVHQRSLEKADLVNNALASAPALSTVFPESSLGAQLEIVARLLAVRDEFDASRQIFYVATGGFDTHDAQNQNQPGLLSDVSESLSAFANALQEIGLFDDVVTFTQSDFGRTLTSNGDGTDHGWGAHQLVLGGPVLGRRIYGTMPVLDIGGSNDVGGGRIIPGLSADQYAATLARWFGIAEADLTTVAPNLQNFPTADIGFLA